MLSTFTTVFLNALSVHRPVSALIVNDARRQCRFLSGSAYGGLNSFAGLKRRACVVAGHYFVTKGSETDVESEGRLNR